MTDDKLRVAAEAAASEMPEVARPHYFMGYLAGYLAHAKEAEALFQASDKLGAWMSAAMDDEMVCKEMKADIDCFLEAVHQYRGGANGK